MALTYTGRFNDGRSAASHAVTVEVTRTALVIHDVAGATLHSWTTADLVPVGELGKRGAVRLTSRSAPEARLTVDDADFRRPLLALAPQLRGGLLSRRPLRILGLWAAGVAATGLLLVYGIPWLAGPVAAMVPPDWEDAIGTQAVIKMTEGSGVCTGGPGEDALGRLVARLAARVESPYSYHVTVANDANINAYAAPGGHIVVLRGLLDFARGPDEVAGVLAHEMGHVIERHATEGIVRGLGLALVFQVLIGDASGLIAMMGGAGALLVELSYSRDAESEADAVALRILDQAEISPHGLGAFFARLDEALPALPDELAILSTHPPSEERARIADGAGGGGTPALSDADWQALRHICD